MLAYWFSQRYFGDIRFRLARLVSLASKKDRWKYRKLYRFLEQEGHPSFKGIVSLGKYCAHVVINQITLQPIQVYSSQIRFSNWSFDEVGLGELELGEIRGQKRFPNLRGKPT